jgi:hypothetical protein
MVGAWIGTMEGMMVEILIEEIEVERGEMGLETTGGYRMTWGLSVEAGEILLGHNKGARQT